MEYPLTTRQTRALERLPAEQREAREAAFHRANDANRRFALAQAAGEFEALEQHQGRV